MPKLNKQQEIDSLQNLKAFVRQKGECLSTSYKNSTTNLLWKCNVKEHPPWEATATNIKKGRWCPLCANISRSKIFTLYSLKDAIKLAETFNGKCLSTIEFKGGNSRLEWKCENKLHPSWFSSFYSIKKGGWCRQCKLERGDFVTSSPEALVKKAAEKGGSVEIPIYRGVMFKYKWTCALGHSWFASGDNVLRISWCPECSSRRSERICRQLMEKAFNTSFPKTKPSWLRIGKRSYLELDGYNEEVGIAFEHQGNQHYRLDSQMIKTKKALKSLQKRDAIKKKLCEENNIALIIFPQLGDRLKIEDLPQFILNWAKDNNIEIKESNLKIDWKKISSTSDSLERFQKLSELAQKNNGKLLSTEYKGDREKLDWYCNTHSYTWKMDPNHAKRGHWCHKCNGGIKKDLNHLQELAARKEGFCLATKYEGIATKVLWKCKENSHPAWETTGVSIQQGSWCPECVGVRIRDISWLHALAKERAGFCLATNYTTSLAKVDWKCKIDSHPIWSTTPNSISRGSWCPTCWDDRRGKNIEWAKDLAFEKGGECLSDIYKGSNIKLKWKCSNKNHSSWDANPGSVKAGTWCPECGNERKGRK